ncbi:hypothetical protein H0H92_006573 [Tricholoma furcatifolium]|nr:hypothetical protein H0H92_006573 [Tricholoma furcatifolium]
MSRPNKLPTHYCNRRLASGQVCGRSFKNSSGLTQHINSIHRPFAQVTQRPSPIHDLPDHDYASGSIDDFPSIPDSVGRNQPNAAAISDAPSESQSRRIIKHPIIDGTPCDAQGRDLPIGSSPPEPCSSHVDEEFYPFDDQADFKLANFLFTRNQMPAAQIDTLLEIWATKSVETGPPFVDHQDLYQKIDSIKLGDAPWLSFSVSYPDCPEDEDEAAPWMSAEYEVWYRDPLVVVENQLKNPDFNNKFHDAPFQEFDENGDRVFGDLLSGNWANEQANLLAESESTHGAMFVPLILGSDKTTVSVGTGQNEYYPLYIANGAVFNSVRRAHKNAVSLLGFLAIPKTDRQHANDEQFRKFRRQLMHASLRAILEPLRPFMTEPRVTKCPDGHFRCVIYGIGPYIADYPEQCLLTSIVSDWCPRCTGTPDNLDNPQALPRTQEYTELLIQYLDLKTLWQDYGIAAEAEPFTFTFPRADIYQLMTSDLLHQVIKGTFKDHLVTWIGDWLDLEHGKTRAAAVMADIDRRIAAVPSFPGLRRFPDGRGFKQWTGDDSKALMKVYLPAIVDHIPAQMVKALAAFLDFCYLVRRSKHTETTLQQIREALDRFHTERIIFQTLGVRPAGLSIPRQHSLKHYPETIQLFGSPNGLCSSITESKHIKAVKQPYRRTNRHKALGQMLLINQRLDKLAALRAHLESKGLLSTGSLQVGTEAPAAAAGPGAELEEMEAVQGSRDVDNDVYLAFTPARRYPSRLDDLAEHISVSTFPHLVRSFLYRYLYPTSNQSPDTIPLHQLPEPNQRSFKVFHSAIAEFYAPSDHSGEHGRIRERVRSTPSWKGGPPRRDCILVSQDPDAKGMAGMEVARAILFFSFTYNNTILPCALVEWFTTRRHQPCPKTGMWITDRDYRRDGSRVNEVIHVDAIVRGVHLIPVYGNDDFISQDITFANSLDRYDTFYINKYADHHANEIIF